jgi:hypothetical protein
MPGPGGRVCRSQLPLSYRFTLDTCHSNRTRATRRLSHLSFLIDENQARRQLLEKGVVAPRHDAAEHGARDGGIVAFPVLIVNTRSSGRFDAPVTGRIQMALALRS